LRDRYVEWGLPAEKMLVLENGQPAMAAGAVRAGEPPEAALRMKFVALGQLSRLKGSFVLLEAARLLPKSLRKRLMIEVHGSMQYEVDDFRARYERALAGLEDIVRYCGPYRPGDVHGIVERSGWVVQPSIWWENSPLVIQEAFAAGRPVICSNVGGMAEKVTHGVNGLHFRVGSAIDLAARIEEAATKPGLWEQLCTGVPRPPTIAQTVDTLLTVYASGRGEAGQPNRTPRKLPTPECVSVEA
jgi:glycosyltransferase involved in cell wall biosynthesis